MSSSFASDHFRFVTKLVHQLGHIGNFHSTIARCRLGVAHVDEDKDEVNGEIVRNPSAPGRLRKRNPAGYSELYRQHVLRDSKGDRQYLWQTRAGGGWNCATQLDTLPDPCRASYEEVERAIKGML